MWTFFHKLGSPKWFFDIAGRCIPWFAASSLTLLLVGMVWGLLFAPPDYQQGDSYRIIFIHVPSAALAMSCYVMMAVAGAIHLVWRMKLADVFAKAAAPIGAALTFLGLFTGSVWGKPTWGTWWVWDARLTSMLILLFLYFGIIALRAAIEDPQTGARAVSVLTLVGVINIPIIKYSVNWWNTLHQTATFTLTNKPSMPPSMYLPLLIMSLAFYLFFAWIVCLRMQNEILEREKRARWVREWVMPHGHRR